MARPTTKRPPEKTDGIAAAKPNHRALDAAGDAAAEHAREIAKVEKEFSIDVPYERNLFIAEAKRMQGEIGNRLLQLGLIFIQLKAHEAPGDFLDALKAIRVEPRFAQRAMQAARKFGGSEHRRALATQLGMGKVLALIAEDDGDIEQLADGGELAGHTADEFAKMTKAQLVEALKEKRAQYDGLEKVAQRKDKKINDLEAKLEGGAADLDPDQHRMDELVKAYGATAAEVMAGLTRLDQYTGEIYSLRKTAAHAFKTTANSMLVGGVEMISKVVARLEQYGN